MQLLSPEKLKNDAAKRDAERTRRIDAAGKEEKKVLGRLNDAHDKEDRALAKRDAIAATKVTPMEARLLVLQEEVPALESRREEALKPLIERESAVTEREAACAEKETTVVIREENATEVDRKQADRAERMADKEDELMDREQTVRAREIAAEKTEMANKANAEGLSARWLDFHEMVHRQNEHMTERERKVDIDHRANATTAEENRLHGFEMERREKALTDKYNTFLTSTEEWQAAHPSAPDFREVKKGKKKHD